MESVTCQLNQAGVYDRTCTALGRLDLPFPGLLAVESKKYGFRLTNTQEISAALIHLLVLDDLRVPASIPNIPARASAPSRLAPSARSPHSGRQTLSQRLSLSYTFLLVCRTNGSLQSRRRPAENGNRAAVAVASNMAAPHVISLRLLSLAMIRLLLRLPNSIYRSCQGHADDGCTALRSLGILGSSGQEATGLAASRRWADGFISYTSA